MHAANFRFELTKLQGVYADMALTLASYLHRKVNKSVEYVPMNVRQLEIFKPLIAKGHDAKEQPVLNITATAERPLSLVKFSYNSTSRDGSVGDLHASCVVEYGDAESWLEAWSRLAYLYRSRIDVLNQGAEFGKYEKVSRGQAYEAFSSLVKYDEKFYGMKEVILDSKNFEASSLIEFRATEGDGDFEANPYWIDNITHLSGFVLNGTDAVDSKKEVYISHGWESLQMVRPLAARKCYRNHVKMHRGPKQTMVGDVYVFDGEDMVALVGGVKFQAIPRPLLNKLLPPISGAAASPKAQARSPMNSTAGHPKAVRPKLEKKSAPVLNDTTNKPTTSISHPHNGNGAVTTKFMSIISDELGLEPSELAEGVTFAKVGLDSLMSLTITGRMREELEIDVPTSLFVDNATIGEAKLAILALGLDASNGSASTETATTIDATSGGNMSSSRSDIENYSVEGTAEKLLSVISEELGIEQSDLVEMGSFAKMGVDSLMSLTISGRIREELELDIPTSFFVDYPTISEAKMAISALTGMNSSGGASNGSASTETATTIDATSGGNMSSSRSDIENYSVEGTAEKLLSVISEELGIEQSDLVEMGSFAKMGVDSLMSLTISGRIREELELDIPTSFFVDYPTISEAKMAISALTSMNSSEGVTPSSSTENTTPGEADKTLSMSNPDGERLTSLIVEKIGANEEALRPATSIVLSGNPKTASKTLFLFPDGSGSATSYALLPSISLDVCVYGLNCPFMKTPADYTNGIDGVSAQYLAEIQRRQPHGPYYLGGWSAGGVIAYHVAHTLQERGETTERLFLIDSPCPIDLEPLPTALLRFFDSLGLLGTQSTPPDWLIPHFEASMANLAAYAPPPMESARAPKTLIILARDGLHHDADEHQFARSPGEPRSVKFLLDSRRDMGSYGWDQLLGEENIITMTVPGNHFTLIREPHVRFPPPLPGHGFSQADSDDFVRRR